MPYAKTTDLPHTVKDFLPEEAQLIFMHAFNEAKKPGITDEIAFTAAWTAVKNAGYRKTKKGWMKAERDEVLPGFSDALYWRWLTSQRGH